MEEIELCSFKPQLNLITQKLTEDRQKNESRVTRRSRYQDENTYRPSLNRITNELMKGKGSFQERQKLYLESKNSKLMDLVQ
jgi:hypothetical protein